MREFKATCPKCEAAGLAADDFRYSPGWVTLWRRYARELVAKEALYDDAMSHWGWRKVRAARLRALHLRHTPRSTQLTCLLVYGCACGWLSSRS